MVQPATVEQVAVGDHACLTFTDPDERLDLVTAFVDDGLAMRHKVICLTDAVPPAELSEALAKRSVHCNAALEHGQLTVLGSDTTWFADGGSGAQAMIDRLAREARMARQAGYPALRVTADMSWAARPLAAAGELPAFEAALAGLLGEEALTVICQYDRDAFDPVTLAFVTGSHQRAVAAQVYHEDPLLRICRQYRPGGVRVAGELDFRHLDVWYQALSEALRLDDQLQVNLVRTSYLDAACAAALIRAALSLPTGRTITVLASSVAASVLQLAGAPDVPQLRVGTAT